MFQGLKALNPRHPLAPPLVALVIGGMLFLPTLRFVWHAMRKGDAWEADSIARSIVGGHGFSFAGDSRWLFDRWIGDPNAYYPTAWMDPVFTYLLAGAHWLFGSQVYVAMYGFKLACFAATLVLAYQIARRFGSAWMGTLAVLLITANSGLSYAPFGSITANHGLAYALFNGVTNTTFSAAAVLLGALLIIRYMEQPSNRRLVAAGLMTGFMVLACPSVQYFLLFLPLALLVFHGRDWRRGAGHAVVLLVLASAVLAPWAIRNHVTFGEFVLVRNGGGQLAWLGTVGPAETFMPGAAGSPMPPPWQSSGPREAVYNLLEKDLRRMMHPYQVRSMEAAQVPGFDAMNEAQRDKFYLGRTKEFIKQNPAIAAQMAVAKMEIYLTAYGAFGLLTVAFAILGGLVALRDPRSWPLSLLAISFSGIFILIVAFYGRYRAPIEPLLAVLAAIGIVSLGSRLFRKGQPSSGESPAS